MISSSSARLLRAWKRWRRSPRRSPAKITATFFLVIHRPADGSHAMDAVLNRQGSLPASYPEDGQRFEHGQIYIAHPDHHLLLEGNHMRLAHGPRENRLRPAIDALFRSTTVHHGTRVLGIVLRGYLADGALGLRAIKEAGALW